MEFGVYLGEKKNCYLSFGICYVTKLDHPLSKLLLYNRTVFRMETLECGKIPNLEQLLTYLVTLEKLSRDLSYANCKMGMKT